MKEVKNMTDLELREKAFASMCENFTCEKPSSLVGVHKIDPALFRNLQIKISLYISKCLPANGLYLEEAELLRAVEKYKSEIPNMTPNGMIVPKRHLILEYNAVV